MILSQRVIIATTRDGLRDDVAGQAELFDELGDDGAVVFVHLAPKTGESDPASFQSRGHFVGGGPGDHSPAEEYLHESWYGKPLGYSLHA